MTNVGMVLPEAGFLEKLRELTQKTGTLLIFDETHTLSSGPGGYARLAGIEADGLVFGKPIAGGIPAAAYGFSEDVTIRIRNYLSQRGNGRSGIGTTLSGSRIQLALIKAVLTAFFNPETFDRLTALAARLEQGLQDCIARHNLEWVVTRVGARVEFMCCPKRPKNGYESSQIIHTPIDQAIHHFLLNRGIVITPFHNMMLICPATTDQHVDRFLSGFGRCIAELKSDKGSS
jgi:glutamate-1-semialdehyde 2,1-aminomutase